jgi:deazaflavin-dependent oxidoreductase (nitroreductase family)
VAPRSRTRASTASRSATAIEFTGAKTGRRYTTPVAYVRTGDHVWLTTDSRWWRNLVGGVAVRLRLRGARVPGTATAITDPAEAERILRRLVDEIPSYRRPAGLASEDGGVSDAEIARAVADGRVAVVIELEATA